MSYIFKISLLLNLLIIKDAYSSHTHSENNTSTHLTSDSKEGKSLKEIAKEISDSYERGMFLKEEAKKSFQQSEKYRRMVAWTKRNAKEINRRTTNYFFLWLQKEYSKGNIKTHYRQIISSPKELNKYSQQFLKKHSKISRQIQEKEIKFPEDVTDKNMWLCWSKSLADTLL